jgi:hypothetical protein
LLLGEDIRYKTRKGRREGEKMARARQGSSRRERREK